MQVYDNVDVTGGTWLAVCDRCDGAHDCVGDLEVLQSFHHVAEDLTLAFQASSERRRP